MTDGKPSYYVYLDDSGSHSSDSEGFANDSGHGLATAQSGSYIVAQADNLSQLEEVHLVRRTTGYN